MLNTPSPTITPPSSVPPARPPTSSLDRKADTVKNRKRGGQPLNRNAFKHGFFSTKHPSAFRSPLSKRVVSTQGLSTDPSDFDQIILTLQEGIMLIHTYRERAENTPSVWIWDRRLANAVSQLIRMKVNIGRLLLPSRNLNFASHFALALVLYDFQLNRITRDADSFRGKSKLSDLNSFAFREPLCGNFSEPYSSFFTPRQWAVIEPLIPPRVYIGKPGRPPADPHPLLDAIFWKLAYHARWQDLPGYYPSMLTCRRYYHRLYLSGRLATIYRVLHEDLVTQGMVDLSAFQNHGHFSLEKNRVVLNPDLNEFWQMRTALLFIQQGYQVLRSILCDKTQEMPILLLANIVWDLSHPTRLGELDGMISPPSC